LAPRLLSTAPVMHKLSYAVLLVVAFIIGLTATVAASRLVAPRAKGAPALEKPVQAPASTPPLPTVEC
jgi:hypothetical protein